jgi:prophage regulatory protein
MAIVDRSYKGITMERQIYRIDEVARLTGLSHSSIYKQIRIGQFPRSVKLTARASGWDSIEICNWIDAKLDQVKPDFLLLPKNAKNGT